MPSNGSRHECPQCPTPIVFWRVFLILGKCFYQKTVWRREPNQLQTTYRTSWKFLVKRNAKIASWEQTLSRNSLNKKGTKSTTYLLSDFLETLDKDECQDSNVWRREPNQLQTSYRTSWKFLMKRNAKITALCFVKVVPPQNQAWNLHIVPGQKVVGVPPFISHHLLIKPLPLTNCGTGGGLLILPSHLLSFPRKVNRLANTSTPVANESQ